MRLTARPSHTSQPAGGLVAACQHTDPTGESPPARTASRVAGVIARSVSVPARASAAVAISRIPNAVSVACPGAPTRIVSDSVTSTSAALCVISTMPATTRATPSTAAAAAPAFESATQYPNRNSAPAAPTRANRPISVTL